MFTVHKRTQQAQPRRVRAQREGGGEWAGGSSNTGQLEAVSPLFTLASRRNQFHKLK